MTMFISCNLPEVLPGSDDSLGRVLITLPLSRPAAKENEGEENEEKGKGKAKKKVPTEFTHTLNATACAVPRMMVAILETHQQEDGTVLIPRLLQPFMAGQSIISKS